MRRMVGGALAAALVLGLASCGGPSTPPLTKAELTQRAEAICRRAEAQVASLGHTTGGKPATSSASLRDAFLAIWRHKVADLEALHAPTPLADTYTQFTTALRTRRDLLEQRMRDIAIIIHQKIHDPGTELYTLAHREGPVVLKGIKLARSLGLRACR